jgi:hypothetical protein
MGTLDVGSRPLQSYESFIDGETRQDILSVAQSLKGLQIVHVNATPTGGGVAEILRSLVPMMRGLGIDASWWTLQPDETPQWAAGQSDFILSRGCRVLLAPQRTGGKSCGAGLR